MTTPPLPSSPAPTMDAMEMSPLPHKPAFSLVKEVELESPSLDHSMDTPMISAGPSPLEESPLVNSKDGQQE
ncbi:uncharacterized protein BP01DRAFT_360422 [Aspergillus saccharolyticus JOP 1030-1]|uniref:Uncharacterized protein n=1 Tax=Aspergillus saccharolyticus JOP 1030-1 TaxID=1450539 RepID=A0A318ZD56_9EURO|nr:hypothetical protein BP01DRAFT_360422 [Aspergillus saccharolyticus JOP 1030-1]PYH41450.1 hypothetical protein BP01DRAFT_360422 [Aspergillus saccharolyticus JOP 1030-1]